MLGFDLGHLATGEVKHLLAQQFQDDHVVLAKALAGATGAHNVTDEGGPVLRPLLFQDLRMWRAHTHTHTQKKITPICHSALL